jgi:hypothetical protein
MLRSSSCSQNGHLSRFHMSVYYVIIIIIIIQNLAEETYVYYHLVSTWRNGNNLNTYQNSNSISDFSHV